MTPAQRRDAADQLPRLEDEDAADTQPLWVEGTPAADAHIARLQEIGLLTPNVDGDSDDE